LIRRSVLLRPGWSLLSLLCGVHGLLVRWRLSLRNCKLLHVEIARLGALLWRRRMICVRDGRRRDERTGQCKNDGAAERPELSHASSPPRVASGCTACAASGIKKTRGLTRRFLPRIRRLCGAKLAELEPRAFRVVASSRAVIEGEISRMSREAFGNLRAQILAASEHICAARRYG
jgi:hypothetical protein